MINEISENVMTVAEAESEKLQFNRLIDLEKSYYNKMTDKVLKAINTPNETFGIDTSLIAQAKSRFKAQRRTINDTLEALGLDVWPDEYTKARDEIFDASIEFFENVDYILAAYLNVHNLRGVLDA